MPGFASWHFRQIDLDAAAAAAGRFAGRTGQTRRAHVLNSGDCVASEQFETCFEQQFFLERIAHLHGRPIFARFLGQLARGKRRACQTIATGFGADVENGIARAFRRAARELLVAQHAEAKNVYQRIALETFVEINLAADGRNADAIAVMRDAGDDAGEKAAGSLAIFDLRISDSSNFASVIGPKRSEFRQNSGRAPIVKMSRMIPPTPVAAPWNGSIALG